MPVQSSVDAWATQNLPKTLIQEAILKGPLKFTGTGAQNAETEDQFIEYQFPLPKEEGGSELHMIWTDTPCRITCWNHGNWTIEAHRHESIEFMVAQHPWLENDCLYADIILPANTTMEVDDCLTNVRQGPPYQTCTLQDKAIEPLGESKSDYEIVLAVADKLGLKEKITQGKSIRDLQKEVFECMYGSKYMTWEEFEEKKYVVYPTAEDWEQRPARPARVLRRPQGLSAQDPVGPARVLLRAHRHALPLRRGAAADPEVGRARRHARRAHLQRARRPVPARAHEQPPALAHARPGRRLHVGARDPDRQGPRSGQLQLRAGVAAPRRTRPRAASSTARSSRSSTSAASCSPAPACGSA